MALKQILPRLLLALGFAVALAAPGCAQQRMVEPQRVLPQSSSQVLLSFAPVVKIAAPAVVNVYAQRVNRQPVNPFFNDPIFRRFFGGGPSRRSTTQSLGSGVIVDPSGLVVTNFHVIKGMTKVKVALSDRREFPAAIVLTDPRSDLAILRIKGGRGEKYPVLQLGDSDKIEVGDLALAIGDPFGVGQTVTQGIISALARTEIGISDYGFFIQTDAAINPGNSGGALIDMKGRLIGLNSAIFSKSGGSVGIGFAIPVNMVKSVLAAAKAGLKQVRRPWLGAGLQDLTADIAESLGLDRPAGALVENVDPNSPAARGGLKPGDVITAVDGQPVEDAGGVGYRLAAKEIGGVATLSVRRDGKQLLIPIKLIAAPEIPPRHELRISGACPFAGATVVNISPATIEQYSITHAHAGVAVIATEDNSAAALVGFQKGDVVLTLNGRRIDNTFELADACHQRAYSWRLTINRGGQIISSRIGG